jgi:small conductance mechanosensitive channel
MDGVWHSITQWASSISLGHMALTVIITAILYVAVEPLISWITQHIGKKVARASKEPRSEIKKRQKTLAKLFATVLKVLLVLLAIFTILSDLKVNLAPLLASAGVAGIAIGFGAQTLIKDALSGFFIILENQYRVGDFIEITGTGLTDANGTVENISIRSTTFRDRNGNAHFIPNGSIIQVVNKTLGYAKVHFTFAVATGTDVDKLTEVVNQIGRQMADSKKWSEQIVDAPHFVEIGQFGPEGFNVTVSGTTTPGDQWNVSSEYRKRLMEALKSADIEMVDKV